MLTLPSAIADAIVPFAEVFSDRVFAHAKALRTFDKAFVNKAKRAKTRLKVEGV